MARRCARRCGSLAIVLMSLTFMAPVSAEPLPAASGLRSPAQRSTRNSAYTLPNGMWAFDVGALGVSSDELYLNLGVRRGFEHGFQVSLNLAHYTIGLFNLAATWSFLETQHIALAASTGLDYGVGAWMWFASKPGKKLLEDSQLIAVPLVLMASAPVRDWLQLDLGARYRYSAIIGSLGDGSSLYAEGEIGARQVAFDPGVRLFVSDATAIEFAADLPVYNRVPMSGEISVDLLHKGYRKVGADQAKVPFSHGWKVEAGVRSRVTPWLFVTMRLHCGRINDLLYGALFYPSVNLEFRL